MADVVEINDLEQLEPYRLAWQNLLPQTPKASFFHTFDWLKLYWQHYGQDQSLRVLIIRAQGNVIGIVPLCIRTERYHVGNVRVLTYPLNDWGMWYGPIGPNQAACLHMAAKHLDSTPRNWDMVDLRWSATNYEDCNPTAQAFSSLDWHPQTTPYQNSSIIQIEGTEYDHYLAKQGKKWRQESRRQARALARVGKVTYERHRPQAATLGDGEPRWDLYEECLRISQKSWQGDSTTGNTLCHENVREFIRDSHILAARLGMLDVAVLKLDGKAVAFQYNYHYQGDIFGLRMGFDRDYSKQSVGKILLAQMIEDSFQRNDRCINLGIDSYEYKRRYQTGTETSYRITCYPHLAWRSQGVRFTRWLKQQFANTKQPAKTASA